jgi:TIR domain
MVDIEPGKIWNFEIEKALKAAEAVIFIATEKATASNNVLNEVYYALEENKEVIPVIFHACSMPFRLKRLQYIDFTTDYDAAFKRLLKALNLPADAGGDTQSIPESTQPPKEKPLSG